MGFIYLYTVGNLSSHIFLSETMKYLNWSCLFSRLSYMCISSNYIFVNIYLYTQRYSMYTFIHDHLFSANQYIYLGLGQAPQPFWAKRCGQDILGGRAPCGQDRLVDRALRPHDQHVILMRSMYKIDRRVGGVQKSFSRNIPNIPGATKTCLNIILINTENAY